MASTKKPFIGNVLRQRPELIREDRPQLVGVFPKDRSQTFNGGALLCARVMKPALARVGSLP